MNCRQITERLPWYAQGTLDPAEQRGLEEHLEGCLECRAELREVDDALLLFGGHPSVERLVEHAGGADDAARDLVEAHLAGCQDCAEELAMLLESRAAAQRDEAPVATTSGAGKAPVVPLRRPAPPPTWRAAAVAAGLVGLIGLGGGLWSWSRLVQERDAFAEDQRAAESRIAELETRIGSLEGTRLGVPIHDLWPDGSLLRSADGDPMPLPVDPGPPATLILNTGLEPGRAVDRLEIRRADDALVEILAGAEVGEMATITMSIELAALPRGTLRILLFADGEREPLETFSFELR